MRALLPWLGRGVLLASLLPALLTAGCLGARAPSGPASPLMEGRIVPVEVQEVDFAPSLHRVLRGGEASRERLGLLVGVVRRQLAHASQRFAAGQPARATDSVIGALYLARSAEGRAEMVDVEGDKALAGAVERVSRRGDEGRAEALLRMRAAALPQGSAAREEIEQHLGALAQWQMETRTRGPMQRLAADQRAAVARALVDPSGDSLEKAVAAINAWIAHAAEIHVTFRQTGQRPEHDEVVEAQRALSSGAATMATIFLRSGDAKGALLALDQTGARRVMLPGLYARIRDAAENDGARDWQALAATYAQRDPDEEDSDAEVDPQLLAAGLWGTSLEAYRRDPESFETGLLVSRSLLRFGMPEAAPLVVNDALAQSATPAKLSASMELLLAAMGDSASIEDFDAARRTFTAAGPILAMAGRSELKGRVEPTAARVRFMMAGIEVRTGNLAGARPLLAAAVAEEPTVGGFTTLALVERQAGDVAAAMADVNQGLGAPDARTSLVDVADARILLFELLRDAGQIDRARAALDSALAATLAARQLRGNAALQARAERLFGRVLEGYGDVKGATRAFDRALAAASSDRSTLGAAMLDAVGRALVRRDLRAARAALKRGIDGEVSDEDLVYGGLWAALLERDLKAVSDGTVERALRAGQKGAWTAKLAAWVNGKLNDAELSAAAQSAAQRVEAAFYTAMARRVAGDPSAEQRLKAVASAPVIDLLEVQLARDLTAPRLRADLPGGVQLP